MKKALVLTFVFTVLCLTVSNVYAQKRGKLELYEVKVPTILRLGGDEVGFKVVVKNTGEGVMREESGLQFNVNVYVNGSLVSSDDQGMRFWCPQLESGDTYEKEYSVHVREKFRGERIRVEVDFDKLGTKSKDIDLER